MEKTYLNAAEVAEALGISESYAYKIMRQLNRELEAKGFLVVAGRVNKKYFCERTYYGGVERRDA